MMIFKDRAEAGKKLAEVLVFRKNQKNIVVASLLRGGVVLGQIIARKFKADHIPLAVAKIPAPENPELAIGALCFDIVYLDSSIVSMLGLDQATIKDQIVAARKKFSGYVERFSLNEKKLGQKIKNKIVVLTDDGIATGSSIKAAALFIKSRFAKKIILAVPVAPTDFEEKGFAKVIILHKDPFLASVSQFYERFPQVEDNEVKKILY